jgi:hydrogenase-4 membrane subunit HyfE
MGLDIRLPLGLIFAITGLILVVYGALTHGSPIYAISEGVNLNVVWGAVMTLFGAVMLIASRRAAR